MTEEEALEEAVLLLWEREGHSRSERIPPEDRRRLLGKIEERRTAIEAESLNILVNRISGRGNLPGRRMLSRFRILFLVGVLALLIYWVISHLR